MEISKPKLQEILYSHAYFRNIYVNIYANFWCMASYHKRSLLWMVHVNPRNKYPNLKYKTQQEKKQTFLYN